MAFGTKALNVLMDTKPLVKAIQEQKKVADVVGATRKCPDKVKQLSHTSKEIFRKAGNELKLLEETGGTLEKTSNSISKKLKIFPKQLQRKFKHASDFGVIGNFNKISSNKFISIINNHINSTKIKQIKGTYRGNPVIHFVDSDTGLNVISTLSGEFISGWKLNFNQLQNILKRGSL